MREPLSAEDWRLLNLLGTDASRREEIAEQVDLSGEELEQRIEQLRSRGLIGELAARVEPAEVGLPVSAFYLVRLAQNVATFEAMSRLIRDVDQVEEAHAVSGQYDWIVKVRARDVGDVQRLLTETLAMLPGFVRAETLVVLNTACDRINVGAALYPLDA